MHAPDDIKWSCSGLSGRMNTLIYSKSILGRVSGYVIKLYLEVPTTTLNPASLKHFNLRRPSSGHLSPYSVHTRSSRNCKDSGKPPLVAFVLTVSLIRPPHLDATVWTRVIWSKPYRRTKKVLRLYLCETTTQAQIVLALSSDHKPWRWLSCPPWHPNLRYPLQKAQLSPSESLRRQQLPVILHLPLKPCTSTLNSDDSCIKPIHFQIAILELFFPIDESLFDSALVEVSNRVAERQV